MQKDDQTSDLRSVNTLNSGEAIHHLESLNLRSTTLPRNMKKDSSLLKGLAQSKLPTEL